MPESPTDADELHHRVARHLRAAASSPLGAHGARRTTGTVLTQPLGAGAVRDYCWAQVMDETRRMAAHLQSLGLAPGSRIAIVSKNCARWSMADFAVWMAGFVSVPLYPTLADGAIRQIAPPCGWSVFGASEVYGMTGNCGVSHATLPGVQRPGTVGQAHGGVQSRLCRLAGEVQKPGPDARLQGAHTDSRGADRRRLAAHRRQRLMMNGAVEACIVTGANLGQPLGIVVLNADAAERAANSSQRQAMESRALGPPRNHRRPARPARAARLPNVVSEPWMVDTGSITLTFKVRRKRIEEAYGALFEGWTGQHQRVVWPPG